MQLGKASQVVGEALEVQDHDAGQLVQAQGLGGRGNPPIVQLEACISPSDESHLAEALEATKTLIDTLLREFSQA